MPQIKRTRLIVISIAAVAAGLIAALLAFRLVPREVTREQFLIEVRERDVKKATIYPLDHIAVAEYGHPGAIRALLPDDGRAFAAQLRSLGVEVAFDSSGSLAP